MFNQITIAGYGLIGSSLARVIKRDRLARRLVCLDASPEVCQAAVDLDIADVAMTDPREAVTGSDLVILAVPVGAMGSLAKAMAPALGQGCIITDTGSVKGAVVEALRPVLPAHVRLVPAHPIAGTEHSGPHAGFSELFQNRWCVLTPLPETDIKAVEAVTRLWESAGARIEIMDAKRHDLVLAITSHLPHLIAYTIVGTATDLEDHTHNEVIKFSASGFRDFTRIAASDPVMWRDIFLSNKDAVLEILQRFNEDLTALQKAIRRDEGGFLEEFFTRTRNVRRQVIEAGQADYVYPAERGGAIQSREGTPPSPDRSRQSGS